MKRDTHDSKLGASTSVRTRIGASVALVLAVCLTAQPIASAPVDPQGCTCTLSQSGGVGDPLPSCYGQTVFTVQNTSNGVCTNTGCGTAENCSYSISITIQSDPYSELNCLWLSIYLATSHTPGGTVASCNDCAQLSWSPSTDPTELPCLTTSDSYIRYEAWACDPPPGGCNNGSQASATKTLTCTKC